MGLDCGLGDAQKWDVFISANFQSLAAVILTTCALIISTQTEGYLGLKALVIIRRTKKAIVMCKDELGHKYEIIPATQADIDAALVRAQCGNTLPDDATLIAAWGAGVMALCQLHEMIALRPRIVRGVVEP